MSELVKIIDEGGELDVNTGILTVTYTYVYSDGCTETRIERTDTHSPNWNYMIEHLNSCNDWGRI